MYKSLHSYSIFIYHLVKYLTDSWINWWKLWSWIPHMIEILIEKVQLYLKQMHTDFWSKKYDLAEESEYQIWVFIFEPSLQLMLCRYNITRYHDKISIYFVLTCCDKIVFPMVRKKMNVMFFVVIFKSMYYFSIMLGFLSAFITEDQHWKKPFINYIDDVFSRTRLVD